MRHAAASAATVTPAHVGVPQTSASAAARSVRASTASERRRVRAEWAALKGGGGAGAGAGEALRGVVALVCVRRPARALALRAALGALGASVAPRWSPLVTHVVWQRGGAAETRRRARLLNAHVVSPLWVEACAAEAARAPERAYPAPRRASDPLGPADLARLLKTVEKENVVPTEATPEKERHAVPAPVVPAPAVPAPAVPAPAVPAPGVPAPAVPAPGVPAPAVLAPAVPTPGARRGDAPAVLAPHSRRKLFTQRELAALSNTCDPDTDSEADRLSRAAPRALARASAPRVVVSGARSAAARGSLEAAARALGWRVARRVTARVTHVLAVGGARTAAALAGAARGCWVLSDEYLRRCADAGRALPPRPYRLPGLRAVAERARAEREALGLRGREFALRVFEGLRVRVSPAAEHARHAELLLRLCGARAPAAGEAADVWVCAAGEAGGAGAGGAAVRARWVADSVAAGRARGLRAYAHAP